MYIAGTEWTEEEPGPEVVETPYESEARRFMAKLRAHEADVVERMSQVLSSSRYASGDGPRECCAYRGKAPYKPHCCSRYTSDCLADRSCTSSDRCYSGRSSKLGPRKGPKGVMLQ